MIKDEEFITSTQIPGPTKEEIRCLVLCKSKVKTDDIIVEIGCGTGGLSLGFAKHAQKVYSIDKNPEAIDLTRKNLIKHNLHHKVELINQDALSAFENIETYDILMIGGSGGDLAQIIEKGSEKLNNHGRIIITAILLETKMESVQKLKELDYEFEIIEVNVSRGQISERGIMMYAQNPISIIYTV